MYKFIKLATLAVMTLVSTQALAQQSWKNLGIIDTAVDNQLCRYVSGLLYCDLYNPTITATGGVAISSTTVSAGLTLDVTGNIGAEQYCDEDGANCVTAASMAGLWTDNTTYISRTGIVSVDGTYTGVDSLPAGLTGAGTRSFFYPAKAAFRAGNVNGTQWDDANVGDYSVALGKSNTASGISSVSFGEFNNALGDYSTVMGYIGTASGGHSTSIGWANTASGSTSVALGYTNTASGNQSTAIGYNTFATSLASTSMGRHTLASGAYSTAMGYYAQANGLNSFAVGAGVEADGDYSIALGLSAGVSGTSVAANTMGIVGGSVAIGSGTAEASLDVSTTDAIIVPRGTTAERPTAINGMIRYNSDDSLFEVYQGDAWGNLAGATVLSGLTDVSTTVATDDQVLAWDNTASEWYASDRLWTDNTTYISRTGIVSVDGTYTGADSLPAGLTGAGTRNFFYPAKAAFRAGKVNGTQWDDSNIGNYSMALGRNSTASGNDGVALGNSSTASGTYSVALGNYATASGSSAVSLGNGIISAGAASVALGKDVNVTGDNSFGLGAGAAAGTDPIVSGANSVGFFLGDRSGEDLAQANAFSIMGGNVGIGTLIPDVGSKLHIAPSNGATYTKLGHTNGGRNYGIYTYTGDSGSSQNYALYARTGSNPDSDIYAGAFSLANTNGTALNVSGGAITTGKLLNINQSGSAFSNDMIIGSMANGSGSFTGNFLNFTNNTVSKFVVDSEGQLGINNATPAASLDVATTDSILVPRGTTAERPSSPVNGMIRYNSDDTLFEVYQAGAWGNLAGATVLSGLTDVSTTVATDAQVLTWNNADSEWYAADITANSNIFEVTGGAGFEVVSSVDANVPYTTADFVFGSPQLADDADTNHDNRMFFDKSKGAFRAGTASDAEWDDANIGLSSIALGSGTASGAYSTTFGIINTSSGIASTAFGSTTTASGNYSLSLGVNTVASGDYSVAFLGTASGLYSRSFGNGTASGDASTSMGHRAYAAGENSVAMGSYAQANGLTSFAVGAGVQADGDYSVAIGLSNGVSGTSVSANTMGIVGGNVAIGAGTAEASLDVATTDSILVPRGTTAERPSSPVNGMIRYNSDDTLFEVYQADAWGNLAGATVLSGLTDVSTTVATDGQVLAWDNTNSEWYASSTAGGLWTDNTTYISRTGITLIDGTYGAGDTLGFSGNGTRAFFYPRKSAFRAATAAGSSGDLDDANIGDYSVAFGLDNRASGIYSFSGGAYSEASNQSSFAYGAGAIASGQYAFAGSSGTASGQNAVALGRYATASNNASTAFGESTTASGIGSTATGNDTLASGLYSFAGGNAAQATRNTTFAFGQGVEADGDYSVIFGLSNGVSGTSVAANTMGIVGGSVVIGSGTAEASLDVATTDAIIVPRGTSVQRDALTAVNGMIRYNSDDSLFEVYQGGAWGNLAGATVLSGLTDVSTTVATDGQVLAWDNTASEWYASDRLWTDNTTHISRVGITAVSGTYTGVSALPADLEGAGVRMFFDPATGAFRAGGTFSTEWDDANIGLHSTALGYSSQASGDYSFATNGGTAGTTHSIAIGSSVDVTGWAATAIGYNADASGSRASAFGSDSIAAGDFSTAMGHQINVTGANSFGFGAGVPAGVDPIVSGANSVGFFMGDRSGEDLAQANAFSIMGANVGIGTLTPATDALLEARTSSNTSGKLGYSSGGNDAGVKGYAVDGGGLSFGVYASTSSNPSANVISGSFNLSNYNGTALIVNSSTVTSGKLIDITHASTAFTNDMIIGDMASGSGSFTGNFVNFTNNTASKFVVDSNGQIGINNATPAASLDVATTDSILIPRGTTAERPGTPVNGMMRYNSTDSLFEVYQAGAWGNLAGATVLSGLTDVSTTVATDGQVLAWDNTASEWYASSTAGGLWTDNTTYISRASIAAISGTYTGVASLPADLENSANSRALSYFYPEKAAFRAGDANGTRWNDASIGNYSVAFGNDTTASGAGSFAGGVNNLGSGDGSTVFGTNSDATGNNSTSMGDNTSATGNSAVALGMNTVASGNRSFAVGQDSTAAAQYTIAMGDAATVSGADSVAIGNTINVTGINSFGFGAGLATGVAPVVSGANAVGLFMGDRSGEDLAQANAFSIMGGNVGLGTLTPYTEAYLTTETSNITTLLGYTNGGNSNEYGLWSEAYPGGGTSYAVHGSVGSNPGANTYGVYAGLGNANGTALGVGSGSVTTGKLVDIVHNSSTFTNDMIIGDMASGSGSFTGNFVNFTNNTASKFVVDSDGQVGINNATPAASLDIATTDSILVPRGTTAQRPSTSVNGMIRYNSTDNLFEVYQGGSWGNLAGATTLAGLSDVSTTVATDDQVLAWDNAGSEWYASDRLWVDNTTYITNSGDVEIGGSLGIGNPTPAASLDIATTDSILIPRGTTAQRPGTAVNGMMRYNSTDNLFEVYQAGGWGNLAGATTLSGLTDVSTTVATDDQVLAWDNAGSEWYASDRLWVNNTTYITNAGDVEIGGSLGVGTSSPSTTVHIVGTDAIVIPSGTTAERPATGIHGMIRYNATTNLFEAYQNSAWANFLGAQEINDLTDGINDGSSVFLGTGAGASDDGANRNTGVGHLALNNNDTGQKNVAFGQKALEDNQDGKRNVAIGYKSLAKSSEGDNNVAIGESALELSEGDTGNIAIGWQAADNLKSGDNNIVIGTNLNTVGSTANNQLIIGGTIYGNMSTDKIAIGGSSIPTISLEVNGTDAISIPSGTTAQRPTAANGMIRYNSTTAKFEGYEAGAWADIIGGGGGGALSGLTDVSSTVATAAQVLTWDNVNSEWYPADAAGGGLWTDNTTYVTRSNVHILDAGNMGIGLTNPSSELEVNGNIETTTITYSSDKKWKKNIHTIEDSLEKILALRGVTYDWRVDEFVEKNFSTDKQIGLIAQEVEEVFPEVVRNAGDGKSVNYAALVAPLIEAVKAQQVQIEELKNEVKLLKGKK